MFLLKLLDKISIKKMIFLNSILIFCIAGGATLFTVLSTTFIQKRLSHLTTQSTPFQVKTLQAQGALQEATTVMTKMTSSQSIKELEEKKSQMQQVTSELKKVGSELTALSIGDNRIEKVVNEFSATAETVFLVAKDKLDAEKTAKEASQKMSSKLAEIAKKLQEIDLKIKNLQKGASTKLISSSDTVVKAFNVVRDIYDLSKVMRAVEVSYEELKRSDNKRALDLAKGKFNLAITKAINSDFLKGRDKDKEIKKLYDGLKDIQTKVAGKDGLIDMMDILLAKQDAELKKKIEASEKQISGRLYNISSEISSYIDAQMEDVSFSSKDLTESVSVSGLASNVLLLSSELLSLGNSIEGDASKLVLSHSAEDLSRQVAAASAKFANVDAAIKKLTDIFQSLGRKDDIAFMQKATVFFKDIKETLIGANGLSKKIEKVIQAHQKAMTLSQQIEKMVYEQQQKAKVGLTQAAGEQGKAVYAVNRVVKLSIMLSLVLGIIAVIIGVTAGGLGSRTIGSSISNITKVATSIAQGDLSQEMEVKGPPEIRTMGESFLKMKIDLKDMIEKIISSANVVLTSSNNLLGSADKLNKGVHEQAFQTEQAATAMHEMSQTVGDVARNASDVARESATASQIAEKGRSSVEITVEEMLNIVETFRKTSETIGRLGVRSSEIGSIVNVINEIADQTNLLALNAAIEAARAGEMGRGFAVVADEVRKLAERTAGATAQIAEMIKGIQAEIGVSVSSMVSGRGIVEKSVDTAKESQKLLGEIVNASNKSMEMINMIATASEEQAQVAEGVSSNMDNISKVAKNSGELANNIKTTSQELAKLAEELNKLVKWFKLTHSS